jgi:hypothetical protein
MHAEAQMIRWPWAMLVLVVVGKRRCMPQRGPSPMITPSAAKIMVHCELQQEERGRIAARLVKANPKSAPLRPTFNVRFHLLGLVR